MWGRLTVRHLIFVVPFLALAACATPATYQGMTILPSQAGAPNPKFKAAIAVSNVTGGEDTNPLWKSKVDNQTFKRALEESLAVIGYLVPSGTSSHYTLTAELQTLDQPSFGITMDVISTVDYKLSGDGAIKDIPITATGTATFGDAVIAVERLRIANEKSIQENIKELLLRLQSQ